MPVSVPPKPELSEVAGKEWDRQIEALVGLGLLSTIDLASLASYCEAWANFVEANAKLREQGKVVQGAMGGMVLNPWVRIQREAMDAILKFAIQFGFTPSARTRVKAEGKKDDGDKKGKGRFFKVAEGT